jgi:hypothetical protein
MPIRPGPQLPGSGLVQGAVRTEEPAHQMGFLTRIRHRLWPRATAHGLRYWGRVRVEEYARAAGDPYVRELVKRVAAERSVRRGGPNPG